MQRSKLLRSVKISRSQDFVAGGPSVSVNRAVYTRPMRVSLTILSVALVLLILEVDTRAQTAPTLAGSLRDIARAELVDPALFDPRGDLALTAAPQILVDNRGEDTALKARVGLQWGDNNYAVSVSVPLHHRELTSFRDRREIPLVTLGFGITNILWRPKAGPSLTRTLSSDGVLHLDSGDPLPTPIPYTTVGRLSRESQATLARSLHEEGAVAVPWVIVFNGSYKYGTTTYDYTDPATGQQVSPVHLSDVADLMLGAQFGMRPTNPGTFVAWSYNYSSLFRDREDRIGGPYRLYGTMVRLDLRRPILLPHVGLNASWTRESDTGWNLVDADIYWRSDGPDGVRNRSFLNAGIRVGYEQGRGGGFVGVFAGTVLRGWQ
jgi:hypothetical protein